MDRFKAIRRLLGAVSVAALLPACGSGSDGGTGATLDATAVSAQSSVEFAERKGANSKVEPRVRPGAEAPLDSAPDSAGWHEDQTTPKAPRLLFASGFERGVVLTAPTGDRLENSQLVGSDVAGFSFPVDFWAAPSHTRSWVHTRVVDGRAAPTPEFLSASLKPAVSRSHASTIVLSLQAKAVSEGARTQEIAVQNAGMGSETVVFQRTWVKFDVGTLARARALGRADFVHSIWEATAQPDFRIRVGIGYDDDEARLVWRVQADAMDGNPVWSGDRETALVHLAPQGSAEGWHRVEIWLNRPDGRFKVAVDGQVLSDRKGPLAGPRGPRIDRFSMMMLGSPAAMLGEVLFDDIELWESPPADAWAR